MIHVLLLLGCAVAIYLACEWFVNAVEWLGSRLKVGTLAVGTVLAAVGTALPESVVTFVAVAFGSSDASKDIGMGASMGGPLALSTIAYSVAGAALILVARSSSKRGMKVSATEQLAHVNVAKLKSDQLWFLAVFAAKVGLGLVAFSIKPWLGILFFVAYAIYFTRELRARHDEAEGFELEPLLLQRNRATPQTWAVVVQTAGTLAVIWIASQQFVKQLEWVGPQLGISATVTALLLSPIATEMPEIMNAIIWIRQRKAALALSNIAGAMMIQATVPSGLGLIFTDWKFDRPLILSGFVTAVAMGCLLLLMRLQKFDPRSMFGIGGFYLLFIVGLWLS